MFASLYRTTNLSLELIIGRVKLTFAKYTVGTASFFKISFFDGPISYCTWSDGYYIFFIFLNSGRSGEDKEQSRHLTSRTLQNKGFGLIVHKNMRRLPI